jgi:ferredoxin
MKVRVDRDLCDEHGQCTIAAPNAFQMNDDGTLEYNTEPDDALRGEIEEAADVCPVQAIFLDGA